MVYINLLPIKEIKRHAKAVQQLMLFTICFFCILGALGVVGFLQYTKASQLQKEITTLNAEKQKYNQILAQIKKLEQDQINIENKIAVIKQLKKSSALTVHVLDEIANLTPTKRVWLKSIDQSGTNLRLMGMALDNQTIAKYMETLKGSNYISDVNLQNSSLSTYAGRDLKSFALTCTIQIPESKDTEEVSSEQQQK